MKARRGVLLLDPSLRDRHSHHHTLSSALVHATCENDMDAMVLAHATADPAAFTYPLRPAFTRSIYDDTGRQDDKAFGRLVQMFAEDLLRSGEALSGRSIVVHSCTAAFLQVIADALSAQAEPPGLLVVQLMFHPWSFLGGEPRQERADKRYTRALLGLRQVSRRTGMALHVSASCGSFARHFGKLLCETIPVHPAVSHYAGFQAPARPSNRPAILLAAGDPKPEKGLCWLIDALPRLLCARPDCDLWIHAGPNRFHNTDIEEALAKLSRLALLHPGLRVVLGYQDDAAWAKLLSRMDAVVLPYAPSAFAHRSSGIFWEALSCLAPSSRLIVCGGTWLANECHAEGIGFSQITFDDTEALIDCLQRFEDLAPIGRLQTTNPVWWDTCFGETNARTIQKILQDPGIEDRSRFMANPSAWWRAQAALRKSRTDASSRPRARPTLLYSPGATLNSYQHLLYGAAGSYGVDLLSVAIPDPLSPTLVSATYGRSLFFHQHWLKDIYWDAASPEEGELRILRHIGMLRALKGFGGSIIWTLHNLSEHDASALQSELGRRMLSEMAGCADHILCHTAAAISALGEAAGVDVSGKSRVMPHPLYDDVLSLGQGALPPELGHVVPPRIWLMTGLLRPYKGTQELLRAWQRIAEAGEGGHAHLVIAGHIQDPAVHPLIASLRSQTPGSITVIPRRLTDEELAGVLRRSELVLTPYREVLTSGTYYLATTFSKPVLAPAKGMFPEVVEHSRSGWLYEGSEEALEQSLRALLKEPPETFRQVGEEARRRNEDATASAVSRRFFEWLLSLQN